jgi:preprotein translocase SecE subunit
MSATKTQTGRQGGKSDGSGNKPPAGPVATGASGGRKGINDYLQSLQYEWRKITWPEKKQWWDSTIVVFVFVLVLMASLATMDFGIGWVMNRLLGLNR